MLQKVQESIPAEQVQEARYKEIIYKDAINVSGNTVSVIDDRRETYYIESQIDAQIAKWQGLKDEITALA